jgi:hypothetical protein
MDRDGRGHMLTGMMLIPYEFHRNLSSGPRRQRAYAHRDGAHTSRIPSKFIEWIATAAGICSPEWCSYLTNSTEIYRMDRDGRGHMLTGMVLIPYEFQTNLRMDRDEGHMLTGMVLVPYEFHRNLQNGTRRLRVYAHQVGANKSRIRFKLRRQSAYAHRDGAHN